MNVRNGVPTVRSLLCCLVLIAGIAHGAQVGNGPKGQLIDEVLLITEPQTVVAGEPALLKVSGIWSDACIPLTASLSGTGYRRLLTLELPPPETFCGQVLTPFTVSVDVVFNEPDQADVGSVELAIVDSAGNWLSTQTLSVQSPDLTRTRISQYDVSGAWYPAQAVGSGLVLEHRKLGLTDLVWGLWSNFDQDGQSRWYSLQGMQWTTPTRLEGFVYQLATETFGCTAVFPNPECTFAPRPYTEISAAGEFSLELSNASEAVLLMQQRNDAGELFSAPPIALERLF